MLKPFDNFFDLNQIRKTVLTEKTCKFESLPPLICFIFTLNAWERLRSYEKCLHIEVCRRLRHVRGKFLFLQAILDKTFSEILKNQAKLDKLENFDICFVVIFDHYCQTYYSGSQENYESTFVGPNKVCIQYNDY